MVRAIWPALKKGRRQPIAARNVRDRVGRHRPLLRRRADVGPPDQPGDRRVLALVGGPPLGRRLLRGLRHRRDRVSLFVRLGLLRTRTATAAVLFSTNIFLFGGIIGTFHHLYFTGTPTAILALGATFSALEVVPLVLMGFEAYHNLTLSRAKPWLQGLQVADLVLYRGRLLEPGRRRDLRIPDQSADCPLLHARVSTRPRCTATPPSSASTECSASV